MFLLDKWYFDLVTDAGDVFIGYVARLQWVTVRITYASVLISESDGRTVESAVGRGVQPPRLANGVLTWENPRLVVQGAWHPDAPPLERTLASGRHGTVQWNCVAPRARATVGWNGRDLAGIGYVERLRLTVPPWRLPFRILRWGRHLSDRHWLAWIEWEGTAAQRWIWLDGVEQPEARLTDTGVTGLVGGWGLRLDGTRDVRNRRVLDAVGGVLPALARRLARPLGAMHEHKKLDRSWIEESGTPLDRGWTVHEVVTW